ncbi:ArnT family glycosyltransferase [Paraflavitalea pollutisoli]|uniref:ArnT family glycosyltransferase n=1 Tax=Paraflavitalea pollutisoli TaxID=3034143 RepID=UPI0023EB9E35|nr:glycosyltransferase family 39 protein [Paraflavitalea sp. H1-2-19X]
MRNTPSVRATDNRYQLLMYLAVLVNLSGLFITILGPDGALYASIAKTMVQRNNYIELFGEGKEWLDKPHFPFWITALSFKAFRFTSWAYKLPAIAFLLMGARYTWLLARDLYGEKVAWWSAIILLTAEHIILSNNDVRAEPYLTGLIIASVYHFYRAAYGGSYWQVVAGALFAGCAIMTKGPFAIVPIGGAIAADLLLKRNWKQVFHWRWVVAAVLICMFITPELYCLWYQFDAHPEKVVFGRTGVSGIKFFFWDSQFGRFMNTGPIKGKGDPSFFLHTTLWAFLPWSILLFVAVGRKIRAGFREVAAIEWITLGGALPCFLLFSASRFQLPHYINIIFPFFAILTAQFVLGELKPGMQRFVRVVQTVIIVLLPVLAAGVHWLFRPGHTIELMVVIVLAAGLAFYLRPVLSRGPGVLYMLARTALVAVVINLYLNLVFYPALLKYQSGSEAAFVANQQYPGIPVVQIGVYSYAWEFYAAAPLTTLQQLSDTSRLVQRPVVVYTPVELVSAAGWQPLKTFDHFHVSRLTFTLLNHATRSAAVEHYGLYLLR